MGENPYFHRSPIRDSRFFFGRTAETQQVLSCVSREQSVSIVGPRRIGKTSLLLHLADPEVRAAHGLGDEYAFVHVDCQALSGDATESDVYCKLLEDTIGVTQGASAEYGSRELVTYPDFEKDLGEIIAPGLRIVFLFDEFEEIASNRQLGEPFFNRLRGLGETGNVLYVIASGETLFGLSYHDKTVLSSPFFNIFHPMWLGFMKEQEARALVDDLAALANFDHFDENDHAFLQSVAGPHPFYIQVACYHLFEEKVRGVDPTAPDYTLVKRRFARETWDHFQYTWKRLGHDERRMLNRIGKGHSKKVSPRDLERLERRCLLYHGEIFSSVFADFVTYAYESGAVRVENAGSSTPGVAKTRATYRIAHPAWKISGMLLLLVLVLGALLVWQAPTFVRRSASSTWEAAKTLWGALGQTGDAIGGLVLISLILSIAAAGIKQRKRIRQIIRELWEVLSRS